VQKEDIYSLISKGEVLIFLILLCDSAFCSGILGH